MRSHEDPTTSKALSGNGRFSASPFLPCDVGVACILGTSPRDGEKLRREVNSRDRSSVCARHECRVTGTAGNVEHSLASADSCMPRGRRLLGCHGQSSRNSQMPKLRGASVLTQRSPAFVISMLWFSCCNSLLVSIRAPSLCHYGLTTIGVPGLLVSSWALTFWISAACCLSSPVRTSTAFCCWATVASNFCTSRCSFWNALCSF
jgi:hypothetical protein